ncbi:amidase [Hymenobacter artigasi]|uniref:Asp-tRNA(Asn)/Glu-tRNA(Gln) amidotransferase A subunit family amidase n=1 Tax=Hymenobacter artigasi TaxID=2719616 RepID=A0ABX1HQ38_9BACT|nr:amidase [Hymenobacter artigasi]NKI91131.1 Asp-tRNA(Asn)/Glu-tRNA(Gln) amidotransferase A subunit family amidase [Hymenobacter artigasi]
MKKLLPSLLLGGACFIAGAFVARPTAPDEITVPILRAAQQVFGLNFNDAQLDSTRRNLTGYRDSYEALRKIPLPNSVAPSVVFDPRPLRMRQAQLSATNSNAGKLPESAKVKLPANRDALAFYTVRQLGELLRTRQVTSEELTTFFLARLKKYDPRLHCVITLTEDLALQQAQQADQEIKAGKYRGPLHGIPFGVKDLFSAKGYKTTWGSVPYKEQTLDEDAAVVERLRAAGAVLCAKLTLGELAQGDVWFGEKTRTPWDVTKGSSGSSAGSASAVAAGLLPFAMGTETLGSIISPSTACGVTGLRPTYGRVSRAGAMALSWTMDKAGPLTRSAEDCAIVLAALCAAGPDARDPATMLAPNRFQYAFGTNIKKLRVGYLKAAFDQNYPTKANDQATLDVLRKLGVELVPLELPAISPAALRFVLTAEGAAAFDDLTRSGRDGQMVLQNRSAWPNGFRSARFIPAVEYLQAQRVRSLLIEQMDAQLKGFDCYIAPSFSANLVLTNLTGQPAIALPNGFTAAGLPTTITFMGQLYEEGTLLALAKAYQDATDFDEKHPPLF